MQFIVGLVRFWALNLGSWAAAIGGLSYFLGYISEVDTFFRSNRALMTFALLLHFALCAIIYHASETRREAKRAVKRLRD